MIYMLLLIIIYFLYIIFYYIIYNVYFCIINVYLYDMTKKYRHKIIKELLQIHDIGSQEMLLNLLIEKGFELTQATLSRDVKELKIVKVPTNKGDYTYQLSDPFVDMKDEAPSFASFGFVNIEFSGQLAVIKTRPGYAMAIAGEIDKKATAQILGTVAGDDTILLIPREGVDREGVIESLSKFIPNIQ